MKNLRIFVILILVILLSGKNNASAQTGEMNSASPHRSSVLQNKSGEEKVKKINLSPVPMDQFSYAYGVNLLQTYFPLFPASGIEDITQFKDIVVGYKNYWQTPPDSLKQHLAHYSGIKMGYLLLQSYDALFNDNTPKGERNSLIDFSSFEKGLFDALQNKETISLDSVPTIINSRDYYLESLGSKDTTMDTNDDEPSKSKNNQGIDKKTTNNISPLDASALKELSYALGVAFSGASKNGERLDSLYFSEMKQGYAEYVKESPEEAKYLVAYAFGFLRGNYTAKLVILINSTLLSNYEGISIDIKQVSAGFIEVLEGNNKISIKKAGRLVKKQLAYFSSKQAERNARFLKSNLKAEGVKSLEGGVQYKVIVEGKGKIPTPGSRVVYKADAHYINGTVADEYRKLTADTVKVDTVLTGLQIALTKMPVGSTWEIVIPPIKSAAEIGNPVNDDFNPYKLLFSPLIMKVELLDVLE